MTSITHLKDWLARKSRGSALPPVTVSAFGFAVDGTFVAWQTVSEIWGYKVDRAATNEACLEFTAGDLCVAVCEDQPGFPLLEQTMRDAFPDTAAWRQAIQAVACVPDRTLLYRRT